MADIEIYGYPKNDKYYDVYLNYRSHPWSDDSAVTVHRCNVGAEAMMELGTTSQIERVENEGQTYLLATSTYSDDSFMLNLYWLKDDFSFLIGINANSVDAVETCREEVLRIAASLNISK